MTRYVIDVNVAVKWYVEEEHSVHAHGLLLRNDELMAPDFLLVEAANVFATKIRLGTMRSDLAHEDLMQIPALVALTPASALIEPALSIASKHGRSVYDALYVAMANREGCQLVTADQKLCNALRPAFGETLLWLGDMPAAPV